MQEAVTRGDAPHIVEILVNRDRVLYHGACRLRPDAIFYIASMTKPITSVAIMMLAEEGQLTIDDPVAKFLDGYDKLQVLSTYSELDANYETRPARTVMTIKHLLSHTSGLAIRATSR